MANTTIISPYNISIQLSLKFSTVHLVIYVKNESAGTKTKVSNFAITLPVF